jgi:hypothetical protein
MDSKESITPASVASGGPVRQPYTYSVPSPHKVLESSNSGGPVRHTYSYSVSSPHDCFKDSNSSTGKENVSPLPPCVGAREQSEG